MRKSKPHDVLVLNRSWVPIHIVSWQKTMSLLFQEVARALDYDFVAYDYDDWLNFTKTHENYIKVHTSRYAVAIPEIIVLKIYDRLPIRDVKYSRQTVFQRDKYRCAYCNNVFDKDFLTIDHIIPRCLGGKSTWDNTVSACKSCNALKAGRTPEQAKMKLHLKPKKPVWLSPIAHVKPNHPCKSWQKFMNRV